MLEDQDNNSKAAQARFENRRRLLKALAVAAPLMITLRGKPAHAQLSSLGSAGILYGPGAYVQPDDVGKNGVLESDLWKPLKKGPDGKYQILTDPTRRDQDSTLPGKTVER